LNYANGLVILVSSQKYFNMRNFYSKIFFLLLPAIASCQLYVGDANTNSYVYNSGEIVFVTQDVNLQGAPDQNEGNFYLRNEGQLIQGEDTSTNDGEGVISVFQQNTRNKWDYHYWSSPVGDPLNNLTLSYSGTNGGNKRYYLTSNYNGGLYQPENETSITSSPIAFTGGYDSQISGGNFSIPSYWLYKFVTSNSYGQWQQLNDSNRSLNPGEGFTMKGLGEDTSEQGVERSLDFRGRPNNGTIDVAVASSQLTLVGNPYPSAMNLSYYLLYNSNQSVTNCNLPNRPEITPSQRGSQVITGSAYFWESDPSVQSHYIQDYEGGYAVFTPIDCSYTGAYTPAVFNQYNNDAEVEATNTGTGASIDRYFAPIGQGFFVEGTVSGFVTALNDFRVFVKESTSTENNYSEFKQGNSSKSKSESTKNNTPANLKAGEIDYNEKGFLILPEFNINILINDNYTRQLKGITYYDSTLGFDTAKDGDNLSVVSTDISYKLEDTERAIVTNVFPYDIEVKLPLKITAGAETNSFAMQVASLNFTPDKSIYLHDKLTDEYHDILDESYEFELEQGTYTDRFEIVFKDAKTLDVEEVEEVKRSFNIYQNNGRAELTVLNPLQTELKEVNVFDISGRLLVSKLNEGTSEKVIIPSNAWSDGVYIVRVTTRDNIEYTKKVSVRNIK